MPDRIEAASRRSPGKTFLTYIYLPLLAGTVLALVYVLLAVLSTETDLKGQVQDLRVGASQIRQNAIDTCRKANANRKESNNSIRIPLKQAVTIASGGTPAQRKKALATSRAAADRFAALAKIEKSQSVKAILEVLVVALKGNPSLQEAYGELATRIHVVPLQNCLKQNPPLTADST